MFNDNQLKVLNSELNSSRIKTRDKGNIQLSYLEGHDVIDTANQIFGFGGWSYTVTSLEMVSHEINQNQNNVVCYKAIIKVNVYNNDHTMQISREDVGFGAGIAKTLADSHEGGAKEAITDGIKRCMKSYGNQLGLSLYNKDRNQSYNNSHTQNYQLHANNKYQQQQPNQTQSYQELINLGLQVIDDNNGNLIVTGENIFANKDLIKSKYQFRWDSINRIWFKPKIQQVA